MTTLEILRTARQLLSVRGAWGQGSFEPRRRYPTVPRYCALGAVSAAEQNAYGFYDFAALAALDSALEDLHPRLPAHDIVTFNDTKSRRKKDILAVFDHAIAKLEITK